MKEISLTQGATAIVDDDDYERLSKHRWCVTKGNGGLYAARRDGKKIVFMHNVILGVTPTPGYTVDHANRNTLDNRRSNLRFCTTSQNKANSGPRGSWKKYSDFRGVTFDKRRGLWAAQIRINGKQCNIGRFPEEIEAARAYDAAAKKAFGEFAQLNGV